MKTKPFCLAFGLLLLALGLSAQDETKTVSLLADTTTGIYKFVEVTVWNDGDVSDTVNVRYFPPGGLTEAQVSGYLFQQAAAQKERAEELARLRRESVQGYDFWRASIDTLYGAGTYLNTVNAQQQQSLQGTWTLIARNGERTVWTATLAGTVLTSGATTGSLTVTGEDTATLVWENRTVELSRNRSGIWRGKRGQLNYILRR